MILTVGGGGASNEIGGPALASSAIVDIASGVPVVTPVAPMHHPRHRANATVPPNDGAVSESTIASLPNGTRAQDVERLPEPVRIPPADPDVNVPEGVEASAPGRDDDAPDDAAKRTAATVTGGCSVAGVERSDGLLGIPSPVAAVVMSLRSCALFQRHR